MDFTKVMQEPQENSTILELYFASQRSTKRKVGLHFPNSITDSKPISRQYVQRPIAHQSQRKRKQKSVIENLDLSHSKENSRTSFFSNPSQTRIDFPKNKSIYPPVEIKYSWQDIENWVPPSEKDKLSATNSFYENVDNRDLACKIKYSWQMMGMGIQTSHTLLNVTQSEHKIYPCFVKYSWQIIGTATQASLHARSRTVDEEYWTGRILTPNSSKIPVEPLNNNKNTNRMSYSEVTQTCADKGFQTELTNCRIKYSWQNLTKPYLHTNKRM